MNTGVKILGFTAAAFGVYKLSQLATTANNLNIIISDARIHKLDFTGIVFRCNVTLQNPTKTELNITQPYVKVYANESVITQTAVSSSVIKIAPLKDIPLNTIELPLSWTNAFSMLSSIGFKFPKGTVTTVQKIMYITKNKSKFLNALKLKIEYSTYANGVFFKSEELLYEKGTNGLGTLPIENPPFFSGLGLVADFKRPLRDASKFEPLFSGIEPVDFQTNILNNNGSVYDTINLMQQVVKRFIKDTVKLAPTLKGNTIKETAQNVWNFIYNHIQYELDQIGLEQLRRPLRSWKERKTGVDCDCYSIFASSILSNLKIPHYFRITEYSNKGYYQHVYVVLHDENGNEIIIDPVLNQFNQEKQYSDKKDFKMSLSGIPIAILSGVDGDSDNQFVKTPYYHQKIEEVFTSAFSGFGNFDLGSTSNDTLSQKDNQTIYTHLLETKKFLLANEQNTTAIKAVAGEDPKGFMQMLDYAISHWNTPMRNKALEVLAANEMQYNMQLKGLDGIEYAQILGLIEQEEKSDKYDFSGLGKLKIGKKFKTFFTNVKKTVQKPLAKAWHFVKKVNPITATIRAGFILALKINMFKMSSRLRWAYASLEQIRKAGISEEKWENAKKAAADIEKMYVSLGGEAKYVKNAVLSGKRKLNGLGSLGEPVSIAAVSTAAMPMIIKAFSVIKKFGLAKSGDENAKAGGEDTEDDNKFDMIANSIMPPQGNENENNEENNEEETQSSNPLTAIKQQVNKNINQIKNQYIKPITKPKPPQNYTPQSNQNPVRQQEQEETTELPTTYTQEQPTPPSSGGLSPTTMILGAAILVGGIALAMNNNKKEEQTEAETIDTEAIDVSNQYNQQQNQQPTQIGSLPRKKKKAVKKLTICKLQ